MCSSVSQGFPFTTIHPSIHPFIHSFIHQDRITLFFERWMDGWMLNQTDNQYIIWRSSLPSSFSSTPSSSISSSYTFGRHCMFRGLFERVDQRTGASEGTWRQLVDVVAQEVSLRHVSLWYAHEVGVDAPAARVVVLWCVIMCIVVSGRWNPDSIATRSRDAKIR